MEDDIDDKLDIGKACMHAFPNTLGSMIVEEQGK